MPQLLGERAQRVLAAAPVQVRAGHDHRPLGVAQQRGGALDARRRAGAVRGSGSAAGLVGARRLHEHVVEREVDERRARVRRQRRGAAPRRRGPGSRRCAPAVAASLVSGRTNGTWSISWSEPWPQRIAGARPPSTTIGELFCCAEPSALMPFVTPGPAVSAATPGSRVTFAHPSAAKAARLLVAGVDDVDALLAAAVVDREQVAAREREQLAHAVGLEALGDQPAAVDLGLALRLGRHPDERYRLLNTIDTGRLPQPQTRE